MQLNREYIYIKKHFEVPKHLELPLAREMAFIRYCVFNVCNFLKCKIGLKGNRTKTLFICSLEKKTFTTQTHKHKTPRSLLFPFFAYADSICCCHFVYFVFCKRNSTEKQNKEFAKVGKKKFETIDKREKEKGKTVLSGTKVKIT